MAGLSGQVYSRSDEQAVIKDFQQLYRDAQFDAALHLLLQPLGRSNYGSYSEDELLWLADYKDMYQMLQPLVESPNLNRVSAGQQSLLFYYLALATHRLNHSQLSAEYLRKTFQLADGLNDIRLQIKALYELAGFYGQERDHEKQIATFQRIFNLAAQVKDPYEAAWSLDRIAMVYCYDLGNVAEAIKYYTQALQVAQQTNNDALISTYWAELGAAYEQNQQFDQALECYQHELTFGQSSGDKIRATSGFESIASIYHQRGEYQQAADYYQQAFALSEQTDNPAGTSLIADKLAEVYSALGNVDKAAYYRQREAEYDSILFAELKRAQPSLRLLRNLLLIPSIASIIADELLVHPPCLLVQIMDAPPQSGC